MALRQVFILGISGHDRKEEPDQDIKSGPTSYLGLPDAHLTITATIALSTELFKEAKSNICHIVLHYKLKYDLMTYITANLVSLKK